MKNIILQHFNGTLRDLDRLSVDNIKAYAARIGADYQLITGKPFRSNLTDPCQKVHVLSEEWDDYDNVLMLDPDMFVTKKNLLNVFDIPGCGSHGPVQQRLKLRLVQMGKIKSTSPYWAGSFYKFDLKTRQLLRSHFPTDDQWMQEYNKPYYYEDEGIIAELANRAGYQQKYVPITWNQCSFLPSPEEAYMIHIRTKITPQGPKRTKMENYQALIDQGII